MKAFHTLTCNDIAGGMFGDLVEEAIRLAKLTDCKVEFTFNGLIVKVDSESSPQKLYEDYRSELLKNRK